MLQPRKFFGLAEEGKIFGWTKENELFVGRAAQLVSPSGTQACSARGCDVPGAPCQRLCC